MRFASLFAGIGGFDLGLERAGMTCVAQVENDPFPAAVLERHWPDVPRFADIRGVTAYDLAPVDLLCGGFPCQDISRAGRRRPGLHGHRSGLWFEFARLIHGVEPDWVVIENVPGLRSSNNGDDLAVVLGDLERLGFEWAYRIVDSQWFGVAQKRRRLIVVGHRRTAGGRAAQVLLDPDGSRRDPPPRPEAPAPHPPDARAGTPVDCSRWEPELANPLTARMQKGVNSTMDEGQTMLVANGRVRKLMPVEAERLQGFPDGWADNLSNKRRYRALGNAVTVNVAEWIGRQIAGQYLR